MSEVVLDRAALLTELGFSHPEAQRVAVDVLVAAGLTTPRKTGIVASKRERCREVLTRSLVRRCTRCLEIDHGPRIVVPVGHKLECDQCHGSPNARAIMDAAHACRGAGIARVVIVGGAPRLHQELRRLWPADIELRIVPGDDKHRKADATGNLRWADVVLVLGGTILAHRVSALYTSATGPGVARVIQAYRTGIEAIGEALLVHTGALAPARGRSRVK